MTVNKKSVIPIPDSFYERERYMGDTETTNPIQYLTYKIQ